MKKIEDEKKVNLIKCPLPKIIYMTMKGLTTYPKNPEKPSNISTYYTKKVNHHQRGLPSLKMSTNVSFSPNKTNYTKGIITNKLNNMNEKNSGKARPSKNNAKQNNEINKSKEAIKKQFMKDTLNSYGLNRYYEKFIQNGINEQNFNNIGFMNKKMFNDFINILNIFPGHTIKMEHLYLHLKKMNNDIIQSKYNTNNSQGNIHLNNSTKDINISNINFNLNNSHMNMNNSSTTNNNNNTNNSNNLNYVTLTFNRANLNNFKTRVSQSQNKSKYRYINPTIKQKRSNSNQTSSKQNQSKKNRPNNYLQRPNLGEKNKSKKRLLNENIISKYNFAPPKPISSGRNDLIKSFFKDLDNIGNNASSIYNLTNLNIFKSLNKNKNNNFNKTNNHSLTGAIKEPNKDKKANLNIYRIKYNEKHSAPNNNLQGLNQSDLPQIKNLSNRHIKMNTQYSNFLIGLINDQANINMNIEMKTSYNKLNSQIKANNDNKIDNYKNNNGYPAPYSIKTFFNNNVPKNKNKNNNANYSQSNKLLINKKNIIKKSADNNYNNNNPNKTTTSGSQRNIEKIKRNSVGNGLRIKLPNVIKKIETQNVSSELKPKNRNTKELKGYEEGNKIMSQSSFNISYKNEITNKKSENNITAIQKDKKENENIIIKKIKDKENYNLKNANKLNTEKFFSKTMDKIDTEENKKDNINININIEEKNQTSLIPKEKPNIIQEKISISNKNMSEPRFAITPNTSTNTNNNPTSTDKNINSHNTNVISEKPDIKPIQKIEKNKINPKDQIKENVETLEDMIYESLRLNRSFSENKTDNIFLFDVEFLCRCLGLCLAILIETSKESPHITEINLEALSASEIKYFFFNDAYNDNINFLFDVFDKEVNTDINIEQISPLDKLECFLAQNNNENINIDISYLKHIRKEKDEALIKSEEEKEKEKEKLNEKENQKINNMKSNINLGNQNREGFKLKTGFGDIERDIKFIDEFFSINNRKKKKAKNYNFISEMSKNILCKELSYINEIDSELNGTNSNINNTNINNNSNNNINEKNLKEENASNIIDNEEIKQIKEIQNNNTEEENNNTFNNEMNELGIISESNDDKIKNGSNIIKNNMSNNSITIKADEGNDINLNEDNKYFSLTINNDENNNNEKYNTNKEVIHKNIPPEKKINNINSNKEDNNNVNDKNKINPENNISNEQSNNNDIKNLDTPPNPQNSLESSTKEIKKEEEKEKNSEEDDIYELDYILDITSIDELTYYLIKRAEIFDEDFNYIYMKIIERRYIPTPEPQTIFDFIADIIILTKMEKEVIVLSLIYIERLIYNTGLLLTSRNWRRIVLTAMIISNKVWDDNSFENDHFSQVFANLAVNEINTLERIFLELINYKVYVKQSDYFKYLMMIKVIALKYNYNGKEIVKASIIKNLKYQEFNETMQNRMRKKVTLNNSAQF